MNAKTTVDMELYTHHWEIIFDLLGHSEEVQISDNIQLKLERSYAFKDGIQPNIFYLVLSFTSGVAVDLLVNLAASWLYDKLKTKQQEIPRLIIERTEVEIDEEQIKKVIAEKLELRLESPGEK